MHEDMFCSAVRNTEKTSSVLSSSFWLEIYNGCIEMVVAIFVMSGTTKSLRRDYIIGSSDEEVTVR